MLCLEVLIPWIYYQMLHFRQRFVPETERISVYFDIHFGCQKFRTVVRLVQDLHGLCHTKCFCKPIVYEP